MAAKRTFAPELLADVQDRYENGDEPVASIAADLGVAVGTFYTYIKKQGWRRERAAMTLPPHLAAVAKVRASLAAVESADDDAPLPRSRENASAIATRLERALEKELRQIEHAQAGASRRKPDATEADRTARTLATLARTLKEVRRLRGDADPAGRNDDDDMPADIDEFRRDLARRIDAFVASWSDGDVLDPGGEPPQA
jgi:hypothetical protein